MYLRITKQLIQIDADRLRKVKEKEQSLRNLKDFKFLAAGIKLKNIFEEKRPWYALLTSEKIFKCYGSFNLPKYRLIEWTDKLGYCERKERNKIWRRSFEFILADAPSSLGAISLHARIFQDDYDAEEYTLHLTEGSKSNIFHIASYFYNKREFYNKIHAFLEKNKSKFENLMGEEFIHQLTTLFSNDKPSKAVIAYNLTLPEKYEGLEQTPTLSAKAAYLPLCFSEIFSLKNKYGMAIRIDYLLGADNTLVIEARASSIKTKLFSVLNEVPTRIEKKNKNFTATIYEAFMKKYLREQLQDCLTSMEKMIDFGFDIYEAVKTNLLISDI